uniref:Uncharacterized protein n=1 Tax=Roseihalotalea indica TaxID=2867963 RepID=A0AA49JEW9_9BACT|nr:hypothetical protein K4G66_18450 [Tunicatimonas sp. TK19036]
MSKPTDFLKHLGKKQVSQKRAEELIRQLEKTSQGLPAGYWAEHHGIIEQTFYESEKAELD